MISKLYGVLLLMHVVNADDCTTPNGSKHVLEKYLECIEDEYAANGEIFVNEERNDYYRGLLTCFANTTSGSTEKGCETEESELNKPFEDSFKDCIYCEMVRRFFMSKFEKSPNDREKKTKEEEEENYRRASVFYKAITEEMDYCLRQKNVSSGTVFTGSKDFEHHVFCDASEASFSFTSTQLKSLERLSRCTPSQIAVTSKCLLNPFPGYLKKRCEVVSSCYRKYSGGTCATVLPDLISSRCACNDEVFNEAQWILRSIAKVFKKMEYVKGEELIEEKKGECIEQIEEIFKTPANNWNDVFSQISMPKMFPGLCELMLRDWSGTMKRDAIRAIELMKNWHKINNHRSRVSCGGEYCPLTTMNKWNYGIPI